MLWQPLAAAPNAELRRWIRAHQVCWDDGRHVEQRDGRRMQTGYEVTLYARHPRGLAGDPASHESLEIHAGLVRVAEQAWGACDPAILRRVRPHAPTFVLRRENEWTPEVAAVIELLHRDQAFAPEDDAQQRCIRAVTENLDALGAAHRRWPVHSRAAA